MPYRGTGSEAKRVDRPDEGLDTEFPGPGGTGKSRALLDSGQAKARYRGAKTQIQTDGFSAAPFAETQRAINSA